MIVFDLQCANGHRFEGWFEDTGAYQDQSRSGLVTCPVCNDTRVARVPSTFAIRLSQPAGKPAPGALSNDISKLAAISRSISEFIDRNFDDVGADFSREALKIHYGLSEPRSIRGVSTTEEEKTLKAEGIDFFKIPMPAQRDPES